jgi:hypothetical protein
VEHQWAIASSWDGLNVIPARRTPFYALTILTIFVPQTGHTPCTAGLPFFNVTLCSFRISRFARHFMQ